MPNSPIHSRLSELIKTRALSFGHFKLASGKESNYYIDCKKVLFHGESLNLITYMLYTLTTDLKIQAVGGPEVGAIPLAAALAMYYDNTCRTVEGFFVRKSPKDHGSQELIEGVLNKGARVLIVEDVVTTGESVMRAIREVEKAGGVVVGVTCLVDRLDGAARLLQKYDYRPLFTIDEFIS